MCVVCYTELTGGTPPPMTDEMRATRELVRAIYATDWGKTGGPLHIHLDDMNLEDHFFDEEGRQQLLDQGGYLREHFTHLDEDDWRLVLRCFDALSKLTEAERAEVVYKGLWSD